MANPLTVKTKLLFGTGDLSTSLTLAIQIFFQLYFLTDVAKLSPAAAGWILGITRCWDAVNDPIIGWVSDRIRSPMGRRRVLLAYGSVPLGITFAFCWMVPPWGQLGSAIYYTLVIIAFDTAFTVVHVGFNALTPVMTYDYDERSSLNGYRMIYSLGGTLAAIIFATVLAEFVDEPRRFAIIGIVLGILVIIPPWIVMKVSRDVDVSNRSSKQSFWPALRTTFRNRAFVRLACMFLAAWTATSIMAAMLIYFANYYLKVPQQANYFLLTAQTSAVLSVPAIVWMARKMDKPKAFLLGIGFWCAVLILFFVIPRSAVTFAFVTAFLCGPGIATAAVIPWSMLPDVIEQEQQDSGERREGTYYALISFFQKLGTGLAMWSIGIALSASGYVTPDAASPLPVQPEAVLSTIRFIIGPATIFLLLVSLPFAWKYPITRDSHQETLVRNLP